MKFITEMELRDLYKKDAFTTYILEPDIKITPGARQFLVDRGVKLVQAQDSDGKSANKRKSTNDNRVKPVQERESWYVLRLRGRLESIESLFHLAAADLLCSGDVVLAEEVMALGKCFSNVKKAERDHTEPDNIQFWEWSEAEIKNCSNNLGKYFDMSDIHIRMENGKTIALLNHLRASLREVEPEILETYWNEERKACSREDLIDKVNLIINILCIMMWKCLGGQKCKT
jgi:ethanolamine utilization cobalamin adenosyltransferase